MKQLKIAIVGDSPGTYICAIYLFTANIPLTVVRTTQDLEYECTYVPGLPNVSREKFLEDNYHQTKNMGIKVADSESVSISKDGDTFVIKTKEGTIKADILVLDRNNYDITATENLYIIEDEMECREAIVVAGAGCKVSSSIKGIMG